MARVNYESALRSMGAAPRVGTYGLERQARYGGRIRGVTQRGLSGDVAMPGALSPRTNRQIVTPDTNSVGSTACLEACADAMGRYAKRHGVAGTRHYAGRFDAPGVGGTFFRGDGDGVEEIERDLSAMIRRVPSGEAYPSLPAFLPFPVVVKAGDGPSAPTQANAHRPKSRPTLGAYGGGYVNATGGVSTPYRNPGGAISPGFRSWLRSIFSPRPWSPRIRDYIPGTPNVVGVEAAWADATPQSTTDRVMRPLPALPADLSRGGTPAGIPLNPMPTPVANDEYGPYSPPNTAVATATVHVEDDPGAQKIVRKNGGTKMVVGTAALLGIVYLVARR